VAPLTVQDCIYYNGELILTQPEKKQFSIELINASCFFLLKLGNEMTFPFGNLVLIGICSLDNLFKSSNWSRFLAEIKKGSRKGAFFLPRPPQVSCR
jgi:hypothetical protein